MLHVRVTMTVTGFTEAEARTGLPDLLDEFQQRPWIVSPTTSWDTDRDCLVITIHYESDDIEHCKLAATDEIWDCVIACVPFSSEKISFTIEDSSHAQVA